MAREISQRKRYSGRFFPPLILFFALSSASLCSSFQLLKYTCYSLNHRKKMISTTTTTTTTALYSTKSSKATKQKKSSSSTSVYTKKYDMLNHTILTAKEEQSLGKKLKKAIQLKEKMAKLVEEKHQQRIEASLHTIHDTQDDLLKEMTADLLLGTTTNNHNLIAIDDHHHDDEDLDGLSI